MRAKLVLDESLSPQQVREVMKKYNNKEFDTADYEVTYDGFYYLWLDDSYIAIWSGKQDDRGGLTWEVNSGDSLPPF